MVSEDEPDGAEPDSEPDGSDEAPIPEGPPDDAPSDAQKSEVRPPVARRVGPIMALVLAWVALAVLVALRSDPAEPERPDRHAAADGGAPPTRGAVELRVLGPDGAPIERARVTVIGTDRVVPTDARGVARLEPPMSGGFEVRVEAPGFGRVRRAIERDTEIRLAPGWTVTGTVRDPNGAPIEGVLVSASPDRLDAPDDPAMTRSDALGRFAFDTLEPTPQRVRASATGYAEGLQLVMSPGDLALVLEVAAALRGLVLGIDGRGSPASVILAGSGVWPPRSVEADQEGRFAFGDVPPGVYELRARHESNASRAREGLLVESGAPIEVRLQLEPGASFRGIVVDAANDAPIAGAELVLTENGLGVEPRVARSGRDGHFAIGGLLREPYVLSVTHEGYVRVIGLPAQPGGEEARIALRSAAVLTGEVVDERGNAVAGAAIEVHGSGEDGRPIVWSPGMSSFGDALLATQLAGPQPILAGGELGVTLGEVPPIPLAPSSSYGGPPTGFDPGNPGGALPPIDSAIGAGGSDRSGEGGAFELRGVPPGEIILVARHPDHAAAESRPFLVVAGERHEGLRLVMARAGRIAGQVVDGRGYAVASVLVEARSEGANAPVMVVADANGEFEVTGVLGSTTLTALAAGLPSGRATVHVESGRVAEARITIDAEVRTLTGRVLDPRGFPVEGARVAVRSLQARTPFEGVAVSGDDGTFELAGAPTGAYRTTVEHAAYAPVVVASTTGDTLEVRVVAAGTVRGRVVDAWDDHPIAGARIAVVDGENVRGSAISDAEGNFEAQRIGVGNYEVIAEAEGYLPGRSSASLAERRWGIEDGDVGAIRLTQGAMLTGTVVDRRGDPVAGAEVAYHDGDPRWDRAVRTDAQGRFSLPAVPPGDVLVVARHPAAGEGNARARGRGGEVSPSIRVTLPEIFDASRAELGPGPRTGVPIAVDSALRVGWVQRASTASRAGVRRGDVLVSIDDVPVDDPDDAARRLAGPDGVEVVLELRRGEETLRLPVARERYVPPEP